MLMLKNELETDPSFHVTTRDQDQYTSKRLYFKDKPAANSNVGKVFESGQAEVKVEQSELLSNLNIVILLLTEFLLISSLTTLYTQINAKW